MTWSIYSADGKFHWLRDDNGFVITASENEQRIRLLGAAPKMLEALETIEKLAQRIVAALDVSTRTRSDWRTVQRHASAAIAAAKGKDEETNT